MQFLKLPDFLSGSHSHTMTTTTELEPKVSIQEGYLWGRNRNCNAGDSGFGVLYPSVEETGKPSGDTASAEAHISSTSRSRQASGSMRVTPGIGGWIWIEGKGTVAAKAISELYFVIKTAQVVKTSSGIHSLLSFYSYLEKTWDCQD